MISRKEIKYKGAIPVKSIFNIMEKGNILLKVIEQSSPSWLKRGLTLRTSVDLIRFEAAFCLQ